MKLLSIAMTLALLQGCGAEDQGPTTAAPEKASTKAAAEDEPAEETKTVRTVDGQTITGEIQILLAGEELPACAESNHGQTFYVEAEDLFRVCSPTGWRELDLRGSRLLCLANH